MRRFIVIAAALIACSAAAQDMRFTSGDRQLSIRLTSAACALPDVAAVLIAQDNVQTPPRAAIVHAHGRELRACWVVDSDRDVLIGDEAGAGGHLAMSAFRVEPGV